MKTNQKDFKVLNKINIQKNDNNILSMNKYSKTLSNWKNIECKGKRPTLDEIKSFLYLIPKMK